MSNKAMYWLSGFSLIGAALILGAALVEILRADLYR